MIIPDRQEIVARIAELTEQSDRAWSRLEPTLEPAALVRYRRIRWRSTDGTLRASLDREVQAANPRVPSIWLPIVDGSVLELKSNAELPPQIAQLSKLGLRRSAHSKYGLAIGRLHGPQL